MRRVPIHIDLTAARRLARLLDLRNGPLDRSQKQAIVAEFERTDPQAAEGLKVVWSEDVA